VGRFLAGLTARDLEIWRAWYDLEPRGDERADYHAALVAAAVDRSATVADMLGWLNSCWDAARAKREAERQKLKRHKQMKAQWRGVGRGKHR
jgi:hypothetical protein